jgi:hypothetical protein
MVPGDPRSEVTETGANVLLRGAWLDGGNGDRCADLLAVDQANRVKVLLITITTAPRTRVRTVDSVLDDDPEEIAVITTDPDAGSRAGDQTPSVPGASSVTTNRNPGDLTGLGVSIMDRFSDWEDDDAAVSVCLDSITPLLQYNTLDEVFHFLRIVTDEVESAGAVAHYHLDPAAHDEQTRHRLLPLFDRTADVNPE